MGPAFDIDDVQRKIFPGEIKTSIDEALDDSDKEWTVPDGKMWELLSVFVSLISTATVGNRRITLLFRTAVNKTIGIIVAGATQAASLTYSYYFAPLLPRETAVVNNALMTPLGPWVLLTAGQKVRIYDSAAIAPAADDMTVNIVYAERDV